MTGKKNETFEDLLEITAIELRPIAIRLREIILELDPDVYETVQLGYKAANYGVGPKKMSEGYAYIIPHKNWVNLVFFQGASLTDTNGLLEGTGKKLRHFKTHSIEDANKPEIKELLKIAMEERNAALKK